MSIAELCARVEGRYQRLVGERCHRRDVMMLNQRPLFSFTFDDFPRSALITAGAILNRHGLRGTYYASLGLMGSTAPTGEIFVADDLEALWKQGHELACHTYSHPDTWATSPNELERTVEENARALATLKPGAHFHSFSYPISGPRRETKRRIGRRFESCRGGGQTMNTGVADLNLLKSFFIEKARDDEACIRRAIVSTVECGGWLIFSTHDVCGNPTPYGVTPELFEAVVRWCVEAGGLVVPVVDGVREVGGQSAK